MASIRRLVTPQTIQGATTGPMALSESTVRDLISVRKNSKFPENPKILGRTYGNQGTPSPSVALECKCVFGATTFPIGLNIPYKCRIDENPIILLDIMMHL